MKVYGAMLASALAALLCCASPPGEAGQAREITVSAAASLTNVFRETARAFEAREKGVKVNGNFAASGDLLRQIEGGAPVDVFASAAPREMDELEARGLLMAGTRRNFAENGLVLVRPRAFPGKIASFADLKKAEVERIAVGNPATVPAGMYAEQVLRYFKLWDDIRGKLILGESVRQVLDYVARGEVDAGFVFATDAALRAGEVAVVARAPEGTHSPIIYPVAVLKGTAHGDLAKSFVRFLLSPEGQRRLRAYGFASPR